jgi:Branched-chain amino acid aminotransferase/4-amino-4-deoxychorismate lyase
MSLIAYVNGRFLPLASAHVHIEDRGFQFADGVYEVIACYGGGFLALDAHLERLKRSCDAIRLAPPVDMEAMGGLVHEIYRRNRLEDAMIYIQITRGVAPRMHVPGGDLAPTLILTVRPLPEVDEEKLLYGVSGITRPDIRWKRCDIKSIALLASVLGKQEAVREGAAETFWLDAQGHVLEGCSTNILAVIDDTLVTHPTDHAILGGITRDLLLRLARRHRIPVQERPWKMSEPGLAECMLTSTTNAVLPLTRMDGKVIGDGRPGPVSTRLRSLMLAEIERLCRT